MLIDTDYDANANTTTFYYELVARTGEKNLSHWVLSVDIDATGLTGVTPNSLVSIGLDPTTGVWGIKWDAGQTAGTTKTYTVTVPGKPKIVDINYAVKGGTYYAIGTTQGPGAGSEDPVLNYSVSGNIYVDANTNYLLDVNEPALANVSVELHDVAGVLVSIALTDASGHYKFENLLPGIYYVSVPNSSVSVDFNEILFSYMIAHMGTSVQVTVINADVSNIDIGFGVNTKAILDDLSSDDPDADGFTFSGEGRTIGFWKHQFSVAITGKGRAQVSASTLTGYLNSIEAFLLPIPFQFTAGAEFREALAVMAANTSVDVDLLRKQLLATELNQFAGLGIAGDYAQLQLVVLAWSEYLVFDHTSFTRDQLLVAKDILDTINNMGH
ncbi:MAG: hypothetical protein OEW58_11155 [Gammaproteobacteria bacterium]|nr:hypothetical protein [Gammaproteobacteria bacterium]